MIYVWHQDKLFHQSHVVQLWLVWVWTIYYNPKSFVPCSFHRFMFGLWVISIVYSLLVPEPIAFVRFGSIMRNKCKVRWFYWELLWRNRKLRIKPWEQAAQTLWGRSPQEKFPLYTTVSLCSGFSMHLDLLFEAIRSGSELDCLCTLRMWFFIVLRSEDRFIVFSFSGTNELMCFLGCCSAARLKVFGEWGSIEIMHYSKGM